MLLHIFYKKGQTEAADPFGPLMVFPPLTHL